MNLTKNQTYFEDGDGLGQDCPRPQNPSPSPKNLLKNLKTCYNKLNYIKY